jgi:hypothetical protein
MDIVDAAAAAAVAVEASQTMVSCHVPSSLGLETTRLLLRDHTLSVPSEKEVAIIVVGRFVAADAAASFDVSSIPIV